MSTNWTKFRLTAGDLAVLDAAAARLGVSRAAVVRELIHKYGPTLKAAQVSKHDPKRPKANTARVE